ncbi:beta-carotene hydroxylase 2, chloroplastic [Selaginella moellendorffii]|uniref:beta-carotene hydroxylase 2, chloroplastic n=1 Tax=Selaginella moellendorffii TaxID=88036 RepID=UPI000D1D03C8|nr:beta-carotene hydroxylase 2, chloroplastic [Selaginella moellendorffii]|eukprot:XP_024515817.1 beta-carotene hydroxylase 2, chloroplastic [Selaginella moellendorffii]
MGAYSMLTVPYKLRILGGLERSLLPSLHSVMMSSSNCGASSSRAARARRFVLAAAGREQGGNAGEQLALPKSEIVKEPRSSLRGVASSSSSRIKAERSTYLFAAVASTVGITTLAAASVYYRFVWQMQGSGEVPVLEMFGTFSLAFGAAVGMEFWARWAHKALWHASLWDMHESHHRPREGPFELNDVFAIVNAVPAIALLAYGFFNKGLFPGLCFGAGLGITVFGMAYMFVHDGLVHRRFPVGPIANVPYFQKVAAAHKLHHADLFQGVPYGLFLGPKELEEVGGSEELERVMNIHKKAQT